MSYSFVYRWSIGRFNDLSGYVESDYPEDLDKRRSLTGYMFMYNGCLTNRKAILQDVATLSTIKAECTTAIEAVKEASWLQGLMNKMGLKQKCVTLYCYSFVQKPCTL